MTSRHYFDQQWKNYKGFYSPLDKTDTYVCDQKCLCRDTYERSTKDKMDYDYFVLNKPVEVPMLRPMRLVDGKVISNGRVLYNGC